MAQSIESLDADEAALVAALLRLDANGLAGWLEFSRQLHQASDQAPQHDGSPPGDPHH